jgi:hypothetical protein
MVFRNSGISFVDLQQRLQEFYFEGSPSGCINRLLNGSQLVEMSISNNGLSIKPGREQAVWSAGCGAIREVLRAPEIYARTTAVLCIDGIHTGYRNGKPGPLESDLDTGNLDIWVQFARDAIARKSERSSPTPKFFRQRSRALLKPRTTSCVNSRSAAAHH